MIENLLNENKVKLLIVESEFFLQLFSWTGKRSGWNVRPHLEHGINWACALSYAAYIT